MFEMELEIDPVAKARPRFNGKSVFTPKKTKDYEHTLAWSAQGLMMYHEVFTDAVHVEITFIIKKPKSA